MEVIISVAAKVAEYTVAPIGRQFGYIIFYKGNLKMLKTEVERLEGKKDSVQHSADEAKRNGEEIENSVQNWLNKAGSTIIEAKKLIDNEGHTKAECFMGHFSNVRTRHQLSRKTKKMARQISQVLSDGDFDKISYRNAPQVNVTPFSRGYEALSSRTAMLKEIMLSLKDPNIFIIGVYGMGGVGKSTLVKELGWQAENDGSFSAVVMATITSSPDVEKIQGQIADALDLKFDKETREGRAMQLRKRIRREKSILIILDDIWGGLDLVELGIPFGDDHKECKLVVTSRDLNALNSELSVQKEFRLEVLLEEDSWKLFEKMAGEVVQEFNIKPIAVEVAKCCAGLPLLIVTVAKALRKKDFSYWRSTLSELKRFDEEGLHKKVYSALELSYNCLESEELKLLFLFIGSSGVNEIFIGQLFSCSFGFGLYRHTRTLTDARNRCYKLISDLKASSLLLESESDLVRIHDVVREVAKSIASRLHPTYGVPRFTVIKEWPPMDQLQKCHSIVLPWSYIHKLPDKLECPELKLLLLQTIGDHLKVPDEFFSGMKELRVLDLLGMMFAPCPPPSLRLLTNVQSLVLDECALQDISVVAELKSLEILSLQSSDIKELPKEIGQLINLRMLNLSNCCQLRFIPANLISCLTCLEELYMGNCFIQWVDVKGSKDQNNNASLEELRNLSHLTALDIMVHDASVLPRDLQVFAKLERYNIYIGDIWKWSSRWSGAAASESSKVLKLAESKTPSIFLDRGFNLLMNSVEDISLAGLQCLRDVLYELNREGFPQLKHLCIHYSAELKYIINSNGRVHSYPAFPNLETLTLQNLFNLEKIYHGQIPIQSFAKLKSIEVKGCHELKYLFSYSMFADLPQLLEIKVSDCKLMTKIIAEQTPEQVKQVDNMKFPKLHTIILECLPSLVSFSSAPLTTDTKVALFDQEVGMPCLETLKLSMIDSCKLWDDKHLSNSCIQNLRSLTIDKCSNMAYAFSSSVARELVNLEYLEISNCQMLEEISFFDEKLTIPSSLQKSFSNEEVIFPKLETLVISHMDHLKSVWHNQLASNSFCKLKKLETKFCNKLSNIIPSFMLSKLLNLETVVVTNCPTLEVVFKNEALEMGVDSQEGMQMQLKALSLEHLPMLKHIWSKNPNGSIKFQNLSQLKVTECESLNYVFPLSMAKDLPHLQELFIEKCDVVNIVAQGEMADTVPKLVFPELTSLSLKSMNKLRSFYPVLHTMDCPVLRVLDVFHCEQLQLFIPKSLNHQEIVTVDLQPLLSIEKLIPNTTELILSSKDVTMLCNGQINDEAIYKVKDLCLRCFHDESEKFPSGFLHRFINLENLRMTCSSFTKILFSESFGTETTMKLKSLRLVELNNLEFICEEKSEMQLFLQNVRSLEVYICSGLKNIVPSLVLFENLVKLTVYQCAGLENILKASSVTNLPKLLQLYIYGCEKIEEIVASDDENDAYELAFMKLHYLKLQNLPRLRSFCKGGYSFKFPLLHRLFVIDCPLMDTFSHGVLNAPKLRHVYVKPKVEWHWNGDLNATLRNIHAKKAQVCNSSQPPGAYGRIISGEIFGNLRGGCVAYKVLGPSLEKVALDRSSEDDQLLSAMGRGTVVQQKSDPAIPVTTLLPPEGNTTFIDDTKWCVAHAGASQADFQNALDWACGLGSADRKAIQNGGPCYEPDTTFSCILYFQQTI